MAKTLPPLHSFFWEDGSEIAQCLEEELRCVLLWWWAALDTRWRLV